MSKSKLDLLQDILARMGSMLLAYSGGVDSTFLLKVAKDVLGDKVLAVTASSPTYPRREIQEAKQHAQTIGVRHRIIKTNELENIHFAANPPQRCYYCKQELFIQLLALAKRNNLRWVADACQRDDLDDFRPGIKAAQELGIRSPLQEAGLTKAEIRIFSRQMQLPTWNKPPCPCLATRFPYGNRITKEELFRVERAEELLRQFSLQQLRVRVHDKLARIEVRQQDLSRLLQENIRRKIVQGLQALGFHYVSLDLQGYRPGSMNEPLQKRVKYGGKKNRQAAGGYSP